MKRWALAAVVALGFWSSALSNTGTAQFYIGPDGLSFGGGRIYIPFDNGTSYRRGGTYDTRGYYGTRGPRNYFYDGRAYNRTGLYYWSPGAYWTPESYWYGDRGWTLYDRGSLRRLEQQSGGAVAGSTADSLPPTPGTEELQRMNWTHLRRVLNFGVTELERGLSRLSSGARWSKYLQTDRLQAIVANEDDVPPTRAEADELLEMLERYNRTADDATFSAIHEQWGFNTVQAALAEFLENPATRYRRQLTLHSQELDDALGRFATGGGWRQYLALPTELFVWQEGREENSPPDPDRLRKALARYDAVAQNDSYRAIHSLPAFKAAHECLARYVGRSPNEARQGDVAEFPEPPPEPAPSNAAAKSEAKIAPAEAQPKEGKKPASKPPVEELFAPDDDATDAAPARAVREKQ